MKKLIRSTLNISPKRSKTTDLNVQIYSHDRNNVGFEFVVKNENSLTGYVPKIVFKFVDSMAYWETNGEVEDNLIRIKFDTSLITRCEEVVGYLYLDGEDNDLDCLKFKFNVVLSEIDKAHVEVKEFRYIKDKELVGEVLTRADLEEAISKIKAGDFKNYDDSEIKSELAQIKQNLSRVALQDDILDKDTIATKEDVKQAKNDVVEEIEKKDYATVSQLQKVHEDSVGRSELEKYATKEELPTVDNLATKEELEEVRNSRPTVDTSNFITKDNFRSVNDRVRSVEESITEVAVVKTQVEVLENTTIKKSDLSKKLDKEVFDKFKDNVVDKTELSEYAKKSEVPTPYDDRKLKKELTQTLSLDGNILSISQGNNVLLPKTVDEDRINRRLDTLENNSKLDNNLLLNSGNKVTNKLYPTTRFTLSESPKIGSTYTLTIKANLPSTKTGVVVQVANNVSLGALNKVGEGLFSTTFEWNAKPQASYELVVYVVPNNSVECEIEWAKLVEGRDTDYTWYPNYNELSNIYTFVEQSSLAIESSGNLLDNTLKERVSVNEFLNYGDITNAIDTYGVGKYTLTFEMKSATAGNVGVYISGNGKYSFTNTYIETTTDYQKYLIHLDVVLNNDKNTTSNLSFFGGKYGNGVIPSVRKLRLSKGFYKNLSWKPSDSELASIFEKIGG